MDIRAPQSRPDENGGAQLCKTEIGAAEIAVRKVRLGHVGALEDGLNAGRVHKDDVLQVGAREVGAVEGDAVKVLAFQNCLHAIFATGL